MFCPTCGSLLLPDAQNHPCCPNGHPLPANTLASGIKIKNFHPGKKIEIVDEKNILAVHDFKCEKCGFGKAELIEISANYTDEDNIYRMKCGRCGHVEQLEGKVR